MTSSKTFALATTALVVAAVAPASASVISYTLYSRASAPAASMGPAEPITSETFNLPLFNTATGTLTGVTLGLMSNVNVSALVTNIGNSATSFTNSTATLPFTLTDSLGDTVNGSETAGPGAGSVAGHATVTSATSTTPFAGSAVVSSNNFGAYQTGGSGGTVGVNFSTGTVQASGNGVAGADFFGGSGTADATVTVAYSYTPAYTVAVAHPVPEPASIAILGAGLVGLGLVRRRA